MKLLLALFITLFTFSLSYSQDHSCGTTFENQENDYLLSNGHELHEFDSLLANKPQARNEAILTTNDVLRVPIVFHIIHRSGKAIGEDENYSIETIESIMKNINEGFAKTPGTIWDGDGVDSKIEFCLASLDPNGNKTTGITRADGGNFSYFNSLGMAYTGNFENSAEIINSEAWDLEKYINIYVCFKVSNATTEIGGVSMGSRGIFCKMASPTDMNYATYIHELGHTLNLAHTFEGGCTETDCATEGDRVCDTPPTESNNVEDYQNCIGALTCGSNTVRSQITNYMDYSSHTCRRTFTAGQRDRMRASLDTTSLWAYKRNLAKRSNHIATGCAGNVPPQARFVTGITSSCIDDTVFFNNRTTREPTAYNWVFENGIPATSTDRNPRVIFSKKGSNRVTLTTSNANGSDSYREYINVNGMQNPTVNESIKETPAQHTFNAVGAGHIEWYSSINSRTPIATGPKFTTPTLSNTTTYYVQTSDTAAIDSVGHIYSAPNPYYSIDNNVVHFTAIQKLILKSFTIYGFRTPVKLLIKTESGDLVKEITVDGNSIPATNKLDIDLVLLPGKYYVEQYVGPVNDPFNNDLKANGELAAYPLNINGVFSVDYSSYSSGRFSSFFNWRVQAISCKSDRVPAIATYREGSVTATDDFSVTNVSFHTYPNPTQDRLTVKYNLDNQSDLTLEIYNTVGQKVIEHKLEYPATGTGFVYLDTSNLQPGQYIVKLKTPKENYEQRFVKIK